MKRLSFIISLLISLFFLYFAFKNFNLNETLGYIQRTNFFYILLGTLIFLFSFLLRGMRWKMILMKGEEINLNLAMSNIFIGQMGNNILPWRMGDLWRVIMMKKQGKFPMTSTGAAIGTERLYDGITIVILGVISSSIYSIHMRMVEFLYYFAGGIAAVMLLVFLFFKIFGNKQGEFIRNVLSGISSIRSPLTFSYIMSFTLIIWLIESFSFYFFFLSSGFKLSILQLFFVVFSLNIALLIPAAPASLGTFEYAIVLSGKLFSIPKSASVSLAITIHFMRFLSINIVALFFMVFMGMKVRKEIKEVEEASQAENEIAL